MEFHNRFYQLRKQKGLSQEEVANRLNVTRQTISKWELGDSTPDMEKLTAISDLFEISLDELVLGRTPDNSDATPHTSDFLAAFEQKVLTSQNKRRLHKGLKIATIITGIIVAIDVISMLVYFIMYGFPS